MSRRTLVPLPLAVALVLLLTISSAGAAPLDSLRVSFINVGQGDSTLLRAALRQAPPPTPAPSPTPTPPPPPIGANVVCNRSGATEICAWVANGSPSQYATQTVYGRLVIDNADQAGRAMNTTWHYKTTTSYCSGTTGANGVASCSRGS